MKPKIFVVTRTPKGLDNKLVNQPSLVEKLYCAVINVSDSPCASFDYQLQVPSFWFPIHEVGQWGYSPFYGSLKVVNHYWKGNKPVLIHCHAGANRSPSIAYAILLAKGYTWKEAEESLDYERLKFVFDRNIKLNHIPKDIIPFLKEADWTDCSLHRTLMKIDTEYVKWARVEIDKQNDYTFTGDAENQARLVYNKTAKRFVIKKD